MCSIRTYCCRCPEPSLCRPRARRCTKSSIEPCPTSRRTLLRITFRCWIAPVSGARKYRPQHPLGSWILGIRSANQSTTRGKSGMSRSYRRKQVVPCLGPQRPRCRIRFASLAAATVVQPLDFSGASGPYFGLPTEYGFFTFQRSRLPSPEPAGWVTSQTGNKREMSLGGSEWGRIVRVNNLALLRDFVCSRRDQSSCGRSGRFEQFSPVQWIDRFCSFAGADAFGAFLLSKSCLMAPSSCWSTGRTFLPSAAVGAPFHPVPILGPLFSPLNGSPASEELSVAASWPTVGRNG